MCESNVCNATCECRCRIGGPIVLQINLSVNAFWMLPAMCSRRMSQTDIVLPELAFRTRHCANLVARVAEICTSFLCWRIVLAVRCSLRLALQIVHDSTHCSDILSFVSLMSTVVVSHGQVPECLNPTVHWPAVLVHACMLSTSDLPGPHVQQRHDRSGVHLGAFKQSMSLWSCCSPHIPLLCAGQQDAIVHSPYTR